ncbi:MAG: hypothetical protein HZB51_05955 [Chloroflexi bacterium]|nr:hypothetical protein [Chloroflexota bacterium]
MKNIPFQFFIGLLMIMALVGCSPVASSSNNVTPTSPGTPIPSRTDSAVTPSPAGGLPALPTSLPTAILLPTPATTPVWTVSPISPTEPIIGKDKPSMTGVPVPLPLDPILEKIVAQAKDDLAKRSGISVDQITLVQVQTVTWPDGSLGCPQPGMMYPQVLVDGLLIQLRAKGDVYEYHSGGNRAPFLCKPS